MMKKCALAALLISFLLLASACGEAFRVAGKTPDGSATPALSATPDGPVLPGSDQPNATQAQATPAPTAAPTSGLYDPSIYVIHAQGSWQMELAEGYYANYECEIYLHKIDQNDNRVSTGTYQGYFWMNCALDTSGFIEDMLGDVPIEMTFDAGGEVLSDNFGIYLNTTDDKAWVDYTIPDANGNPLPLTQDTPVAKGSFVVVAKSVFLEAHASGAQGEKVDYSDYPKDQQFDMSYVVHMDPDASEAGGVRKVIFYITDSSGNTFTVEGTMTRLSGYPEDVSDYLNSQEYQDVSTKHFQE
ncbi:MAG TPA: hypothetical protein VN540_00140 [Clostridia bacterium]|nr:hypothetical protein [Clostridia bacterium]